MREAGEEKVRGGERKYDYDANKMAKRTARGCRYPAVKMAADGGDDERR